MDLGCLAAAVICAIASHKQHHAQAATWPHARILATPASAVQAYVYCCAASPCCAAQMNKGANDVPIVDPPERVAGYFKLNRTVDAHMFYFFYESRCGNCCQKGMKFDWQQCTWAEVAVLGLPVHCSACDAVKPARKAMNSTACSRHVHRVSQAGFPLLLLVLCAGTRGPTILSSCG